MMAKNAHEALAELLKLLRHNKATKLAEEIELVIARGITREVERKWRAKELVQMPLNPDEAYRVAVEMLLASMDPLFIRKNIQNELFPDDDLSFDVDWRQDFVEESPITPEKIKSVSLPKLKVRELYEFEKNVRNLLALLQEE